MRTRTALLLATPFLAGAVVAFAAFPTGLNYAHPQHMAAAAFNDVTLHPPGLATDVAQPLAENDTGARQAALHPAPSYRVYRCLDTNGDLRIVDHRCEAPDSDAETDATPAPPNAEDTAADTASTESVNADIAASSHGAALLAAAPNT